MKRWKQRHRRARLDVALTTVVVAAMSAVLGLPGTVGASSGTSEQVAAHARATRAPLAGAVPGPLTVEHDQFVDADGRVVFLHGLFGVWKIPGGLPPDNNDLDGFTPADANLVAGLGFDSFRLAWFWSDLEPVQGKYDISYLSRYKALARELERRGLFVLVDSHQDMYSSEFGGDGFPTWASPASDTDPDPAKFPIGYFTTPVETAFDDFWANVDSVQNEYDGAWVKVASAFVGDPMVAGYDLLNEPFPGSTVSSCLGPQGCKKVDATSIEPAESAAAEAIRSVDTGHIAFYEPNILFNWGQPTGLKDPPAAAGTVGFSFHDQCEERAAWEASGGTIQPTPAQEATCLRQSEAPLRHAHSTAAKLGAVPFMTEVDPITDSDAAGLECILEDADAHMTSWTYGLSWTSGELESMDPAKEAVLARTYPVAVAGAPQSFSFDARSGNFEMRYRSDDGPAPTVISVPTAIHYPHGYKVTVTGGGVVTSAPGAQALTITAPSGVEVRVSVTPIGTVVTAATSLPSCTALLNPSA
jgi:endoglycosylceramidase